MSAIFGEDPWQIFYIKGRRAHLVFNLALSYKEEKTSLRMNWGNHRQQHGNPHVYRGNPHSKSAIVAS